MIEREGGRSLSKREACGEGGRSVSERRKGGRSVTMSS